MNPTAEHILGYSSREAVGQPVQYILIAVEDLSAALAAAQQGNRSFRPQDIRLYHRSGDSFQAQIEIIPVIHQDRVEALILLLQDLSKLEGLRIRAKQLEQRALLGEMSALFSHDARGPIHNISMEAQEMLHLLPEEDPNRERAKRMMSNADRLADLLSSVLSIYKPTDLVLEPVDLGKLLQRMVARWQSRLAHIRIQTHLRVESGNIQVMGNLHALEQVFDNLITNASQAMSESGGNLIIRVRRLVS
jgi:PAS domain S-box-containing protein